MKKRLPIGIEFYKEMIEKEFYYIEKRVRCVEMRHNRHCLFGGVCYNKLMEKY